MANLPVAAAVPAYGDLVVLAGRIEVDSAFAHFYAATFPQIYGFIRCQVRDPDTARELVSRIYLKAYRYRAKAPPGGSVVQWVFRIAHTTLIDYWRVEGRHDRVSVSLEELAELPAKSCDPEAAYVEKERVAKLLSVMSDLRDQDRVLLGLRFAGQQTNRKIAGILGISEAAVSMRLLRLLRRLRDRLHDLEQ